MYKSRIANAIQKFGQRHQTPAVMAGVLEDIAGALGVCLRQAFGAAVVLACLLAPAIYAYIRTKF